MIPKIIHQTWKTTRLPEKERGWHEKIKQLHPGWRIILWTDEDNLALVKDRFPHLLDSYNLLMYDIMRADIIRVMYMFIYGGYYLDMDYELFTPFDTTISDTELLLPLTRKSGNKVRIGNSIFGSSSGHLFWKDVLDDFGRNPPVKKFFNKFEVLKLTGPDFISDVYFKAPYKYKGTLVEKNVFHPNNSLTKKKNYKIFLKQGGSRGIHHCHGSWLKKDNSLINHFSRSRASVGGWLNKILKL